MIGCFPRFLPFLNNVQQYVYLRQYSAILRQQIPTLDFAAALRAEFDRASRGPKRECQFVESRARGSTTFYAKVTSMALCHRS